MLKEKKENHNNKKLKFVNYTTRHPARTDPAKGEVYQITPVEGQNN